MSSPLLETTCFRSTRASAQKLSPRIGLYNCFLKVWNSIRLNQDTAPQPKSQADRSLEAITSASASGFPSGFRRGFLDTAGR